MDWDLSVWWKPGRKGILIMWVTQNKLVEVIENKQAHTLQKGKKMCCKYIYIYFFSALPPCTFSALHCLVSHTFLKRNMAKMSLFWTESWLIFTLHSLRSRRMLQATWAWRQWKTLLESGGIRSWTYVKSI